MKTWEGHSTQSRDAYTDTQWTQLKEQFQKGSNTFK